MSEPTEKQKIGRIGEGIAKIYLENKGFSIIGQNYLKKCGEIDIIAEKCGIIHFIEVKTVSELANSRPGRSEKTDVLEKKVSCETDKYRAEENIHPYKLKRLSRVIQIYLLEKYTKGEPEWVLDALIVKLNIRNKKAIVGFIGNISI